MERVFASTEALAQRRVHAKLFLIGPALCGAYPEHNRGR
jgi:hypothetical protein